MNKVKMSIAAIIGGALVIGVMAWRLWILFEALQNIPLI